jgi:predicted dehydrogenase
MKHLPSASGLPRREFLKLSAISLALSGAVQRGTGADRLPIDLPERPIRVGQIGTKHGHAAGKMEALRRLSPLFEVVGIVEPDPARRAAVERSRSYEGLAWMTEEELLNRPDLDAVAIETEGSDLLDVAERVVAAGKHVHLDKPAGESPPQFKRIMENASRQRLTVQMGYMLRYNPAFQLCYRAIREGWLGNIFSVEAVMGKVLEAESRRELLRYPGGAMFELGCHLIDAVVYVLGKPRSVQAHSRRSSSADGLADNQLAVLEYRDAIATVRSSFLEVEGFGRRQFVVCGDEGTLEIRPLEPPHVRLALTRSRGGFRAGEQMVPMPRLPRYDGEFIDLALVIHGEKPFAWPPEHDVAVQETILSASGL